MSKRKYESPGVISNSKFERRGILAACCQTGSGDQCGSYSAEKGEDGSQLCENNERTFQSTGGQATSTS
jgi:hypothetical protein